MGGWLGWAAVALAAPTSKPVKVKSKAGPSVKVKPSAARKVSVRVSPKAAKKLVKKSSRATTKPAKKKKKAISLLKFLQILKKRVEASQKRKLQQKAKGKKAKKSKTVKARCPDNQRHGKHCVGRSYGPSVTTKIVKCPLGGEPVEIVKIKGMKIKGRDSDLRPRYTRFGQAEFLWICKRSLYAAYTGDFFKPFDKAKMKRALAPVRRAFKSYSNINGAMRYIAAAAAYQARGKDARFFGRLFLRATWAAREAGDKEREGHMRRRALMAMSIAYKRNLYPLKKQPSITYLLGELNRQEGRFVKASKWLNLSMSLLQQARKKSKRKGLSFEGILKRCMKRVAKKDKAVHPLH
jgi:hypothetical protein